MRKKPKILKVKPEVTEEEIKSYMDFDQLLMKRNKVMSPKIGIGTGAKLVAGASSVLVVAALCFYYYNNRPATITDTSGEGQTQESIPMNNPVTNDSITTQKARHDISDSHPVSTEQEEEHIRVEKEKNESNAREMTPDDQPADKDLSPAEPDYQQAEPVEGYQALYAYFEDQLVYPHDALKDSIKGVTMVSFVIDRAGKAGKIEVKQSLGGLFDAEAVRLVENMPAWKPALLDGRPVPSKVSVPLTFNFKRDKKD
ncbi:MAG: energy transducer TonB [Cyclobacteriaceae bacterium]|nr:energy transducer TonB [Cyclobacteriaceae bacterium]